VQSDNKLRKTLTRWELTYLSLGGIIGSGWLFAPLAAAAYAGGASIISWILGGILMIFIALSYAEISSAIPKSGGIIRYPHYTHGRIVGFTMAWVYLISAVSTVSIEAIATTTYLSHFVPSLYNVQEDSLTLQGILVTYALLIIFFFANYFGVKILGRISHGIGWWKLIIPTVTAILLFIYFNPQNFSNFISNNVEGYGGINGILYAIPSSGIIFSYLGFRQAIEYGGEGKNPQKDIPFAIISSLLIAMLIFTILQIGFIGSINWSKIGLSPGDWGSLLSSPLSNAPIYSVFEINGVSLFLDIWLSILIFDAIISPAGTGIIYTGTTARTFYGSATNGYLPRIFSEIKKTGIPEFSLIVSIIAAAIFLLPLPSWYAIVSISSSATVLTYIMGGIGLHSLRHVATDLRRPYELKLWKIVAPISTITAGLLVYWSGFSTLFYIIVMGLLGLTVFFALNSKMKIINITSGIIILFSSYLFYMATNGLNYSNNIGLLLFLLMITSTIILQLLFINIPTKEIKASLWLLIFMLGIMPLSYFSPFGLVDLIPFPYDLIIVSLILIVIHYAAVKSSIRTSELEEIINANAV